MENQLEKKMENEMETGLYRGYIIGTPKMVPLILGNYHVGA